VEVDPNAPWCYPFLSDLFGQAKDLIEPLETWVDPDGAAEPADPKAKKGKGAVEEEPDDARQTPVEWKLLQESLLREKVSYMYRLSSLEQWAKKELDTVSDKSDQLWEKLKLFYQARNSAENDALNELNKEIEIIIEEEKRFEFALEIKDTKFYERHNLVMYEPHVEPVKPDLEKVADDQFNNEQLDRLLNYFATLGRTCSLSQVEDLMSQLTSFGEKYNLNSCPKSWATDNKPDFSKFVDKSTNSIDTIELLLSLAFKQLPTDTQLDDIKTHFMNNGSSNESWPDKYLTEQDVLTMPWPKPNPGYDRSQGLKKFLFNLIKFFSGDVNEDRFQFEKSVARVDQRQNMPAPVGDVAGGDKIGKVSARSLVGYLALDDSSGLQGMQRAGNCFNTEDFTSFVDLYHQFGVRTPAAVNCADGTPSALSSAELRMRLQIQNNNPPDLDENFTQVAVIVADRFLRKTV